MGLGWTLALMLTGGARTMVAAMDSLARVRLHVRHSASKAVSVPDLASIGRPEGCKAAHGELEGLRTAWQRPWRLGLWRSVEAEVAAPASGFSTAADIFLFPPFKIGRESLG